MKIISSLILCLIFTQILAQTPQEKIDSLLDNWHLAAANADESKFFGSMTADAHYIGTDENEDWERDEMEVWAKPFFKKVRLGISKRKPAIFICMKIKN